MNISHFSRRNHYGSKIKSKRTPGQSQPSSPTPDISVRVDRMNDVGKIRAFVSANIGGAFAIHGIKVVDSDKGMFVAMPQNKFKTADAETKYLDEFHPITTEARNKHNEAVLAAYE
ncbi:MAG: hypothetical protein HFE63_06930 [Clostridiales bacterium]|nr:hypothetical protein [Clostridiales bacterium]